MMDDIEELFDLLEKESDHIGLFGFLIIKTISKISSRFR